MNYNGLKEDKRLVKVVPSARQIAYENMEFFCFIHFTVNTFTGSEWGDGTEPESIFNPTELDARQWAKTAAEGGMKGLILTCKHHDGFCLWPSKYTEHSIKNSPYKTEKGILSGKQPKHAGSLALNSVFIFHPGTETTAATEKEKSMTIII